MMTFVKKIVNGLLICLFYAYVIAWIGISCYELVNLLMTDPDCIEIIKCLFAMYYVMGIILIALDSMIIFSKCRFIIKSHLANHPFLSMMAVYLTGGCFATHIFVIFLGCMENKMDVYFDIHRYGLPLPIINIPYYRDRAREYKCLLEGKNPLVLYLTGRLAYTMLRNHEKNQSISGMDI